MGVFYRLKDFLFGHVEQTVVIRPAFIGFTHSHGAFRGRPVSGEFNRTNSEYFITHTCSHAGIHQIVEQSAPGRDTYETAYRLLPARPDRQSYRPDIPRLMH